MPRKNCRPPEAVTAGHDRSGDPRDCTADFASCQRQRVAIASAPRTTPAARLVLVRCFCNSCGRGRLGCFAHVLSELLSLLASVSLPPVAVLDGHGDVWVSFTKQGAKTLHRQGYRPNHQEKPGKDSGKTNHFFILLLVPFHETRQSGRYAYDNTKG